MINTLNKAYLRAGVAVTSALLMLGTSTAFAGNDVSALESQIQSNVNALPKLVGYVAYLCGTGLGVAGIFKLKAHVDAPAQAPMKDGVIRLVAAGGLLALPSVLATMVNSTNSGGTLSSATLIGS